MTLDKNLNKDAVQVFKPSLKMLGLVSIVMAMLIALFYDGLELMVDWWMTREEYGHGVMIPFIVAFLIWQKKDKLETMQFTSSVGGFVLVLLGVMLYYLGELSSIYILIQYAFVLTLIGMFLSIVGFQSFKLIFVPLLMLIFMLPLPNFIFNDLSAQLQLISSQLGVAVIRLFDISVYLEGNVIDLGVYKLQVVEACSGLNYLFPLMTLGFMSSYFFTGALWKKVVIFLSSIPITIFMNSLRIGMIGVTVEYGGIEMAEGVLHDFEGWAVFMSCIVILVAEMWILARVGKNKLPLREAFGVEFPDETPENAIKSEYKMTKSFIYSLILILIALPVSFALEKRSEIIPDRKTYSEFPLKIGEWTGRTDILEQVFVDKLKLTDYILANYRKSDMRGVVNFYSAYYSSQRKESTTHSPRACIPGGGWTISEMKTIPIEIKASTDKVLFVNRLVIQKNKTKQLVYYWFKQRDRNITNEQMIKWYFFVDSLYRQRTDGALMRVTTVVPEGAAIEDADVRLVDFVNHVDSFISDYVPD